MMTIPYAKSKIFNSKFYTQLNSIPNLVINLRAFTGPMPPTPAFDGAKLDQCSY